MSFRKRFLYLLLFGLVLVGLDALCAPFVLAHGLRYWIGWTAQRHHLVAEIGAVDAPFLRAVTIRDLRITSAKGTASEVAFHAATVVVDLNIRGWIFSKRAHLLRSLSADNMSGRIDVSPRASAPRLDWRLLAQFLPDNFKFDHLDFDVSTTTTACRFRDVVLSASAIESGKFLAQELSVTSPLLRRTFANLRGATSWEAGRLTIGGIPLVPGLDLEALTIDLSHLARRRLGLDLHLDTYGGTLRASFQGRAGAKKFAVDVAGSAANVSLAQFSQAIGFLEPITGAVRASKFTFRGSPGESLDGTASVWIELTDFAWRARRAENVMLGATYYDRRLVVDQLYVRQRHNELTVNGELLWPQKTSGWTRPPFRGQLNASIPDLNGFAQFLGATTGDFSGALFADGDIDSLAPEAHGRLALHGQEVKYRGVALDSLGASLQLKGTETTVENLEVRHAQDFVRAQGSFDLADGHRFAGRLTGAIDDLSAYAALLPDRWRSSKVGGGVTFDWSGDGTLAAHSGTMQFFARGLQLPVAPLRLPLDVTLEGTYSPQDFFFRTFKLASERVSLGAFLLLRENFVELQGLEMNLDGVPRLRGTLFLPFSLAQWRSSRSLLDALDEGQKFDVDLAVDHLDVARLLSVLGEESNATGVLDGKLAAFGPLRSLQLTTSWRLENLGPAAAKNVIDLHGRYEDGRADLDAKATCGVSKPVTLQAWLPLLLEKARLKTGKVIDPAEQFLFKMDCPALFLETLPNEWRWGAEQGLVSGGIAFSSTLQAPAISGEVQILDAHFVPPPPWPELRSLAARIRFMNTEALAEPMQFQVNGKPISLRGRFSASPSTISLTLTPAGDSIALADAPPSGANLSTVRMVGEGRSEGEPRLREIVVRGGIGAAPWSVTMTAQEGQAAPSQTTFFLSSRAEGARPLLLRVVPTEDAPSLQLATRKPDPPFR